MMTSLANEVPGTVPPPPPQGRMAEDPQPAASSQSLAPAFLQTAKHPTVCMLHLGVKLLCLINFTLGSFVFGGFFGEYVFTFVSTTLFLAVDFWIVKNISGRLLVGMRWTNEVKEDGTNEWKYERATAEQIINSTDKTVFWTGLVGWPFLWVTLAFFYLIQLRLDWLLLAFIGIILSGANLIGFWKCSFESKRKVQEFASSALFKTMTSRMAAFLSPV